MWEPEIHLISAEGHARKDTEFVAAVHAVDVQRRTGFRVALLLR